VTVDRLGPSGIGLISQSVFEDDRGSLTATDLAALPFLPVRMFTVYDVPPGDVRGVHAHRRCEQILTCVRGSVLVTWDDGSDRGEVTLDRPSQSVYMPALVWGSQRFADAATVLVVLASQPYDRSDYIESYDDFIAAVSAQR
jgi:UDP-2-acetamido-3-amino-2,3-dideoxy-glucuronate N-acetyltransferase